jgi:hypothetical protein
MEEGMRKIAWALLPIVLGSCDPITFGAVSIRPIYGWVDGCSEVKVSGHKFGDDVTGAVAGEPFTNIVLPTKELDKGFFFTATMPAGATNGFAEVSVTSGGETSTIPDAYYYVTCPAAIYPETAAPTEGVTAGTVVTLTGCNLDATLYRVQVGAAEPVAMTSVCGTGIATFTAPDLPALPDGAGYAVSFVDANGVLVYPQICDTADTATPCDIVHTLVYGGAR